jgi:hypothetical protein
MAAAGAAFVMVVCVQGWLDICDTLSLAIVVM